MRRLIYMRPGLAVSRGEPKLLFGFFAENAEELKDFFLAIPGPIHGMALSPSFCQTISSAISSGIFSMSPLPIAPIKAIAVLNVAWLAASISAALAFTLSVSAKAALSKVLNMILRISPKGARLNAVTK
jgi:hypothetical protein